MATAAPGCRLMAERRYRVGIDVGGTFTHAVALDHETFEIVGQTKVLTTHRAAEGVARGVAEALAGLLKAVSIPAEEIAFIAHSTTQATNALLEGDVASVGIIGMGSGLEGRRAAAETRIGDLRLAAGRALRTYHGFVESAQATPDRLRAMVSELVDAGARAIVAAEAFGVDDPTCERAAIEAARSLGVPATASHEVSGLYGLRVRTRTAAVNASILPRMVETAEMTERSVRAAGIVAPLMVMRSDGGVMTIDEMRRRPILTILSGPAAGVAAALMYARISNGVFIEVGGTSTDISVIRNGRAAVRAAEVGGHRLFLRTLDVRTIGVAGGSMPRLGARGVADVGPRSAHLASLPYACFATEAELKADTTADVIAPLEGDPADYAIVRADGGMVAVTTTCAANALNRLPEGDYARGNAEAARNAWGAVAARAGGSAEEVAGRTLELGAGKAVPVIERLMAEHDLPHEDAVLVGGGGGAGVLVPAIAEAMGLRYRVAENAPVISAIGVALALVRDTVERTIPKPSKDDLLRIRREAEEAVVRAGAAPETIEVHVEVDAQRNVVRATASGATELRARDLAARAADESVRWAAAAEALGVAAAEVIEQASIPGMTAYVAHKEKRMLLGLLRTREQPLRLVDGEGLVRLALHEGSAERCDAGDALAAIGRLIETKSQYGDAGRTLPAVFLVLRGRIADLSNLLTPEQVLSLVEAEVERLAPEEPVLIIVSGRGGR